ncbi:MAG: FGGY-family carbohydrate kinase [Clostridiales bacterium]|nr:FGGY-family carbohydrate kinase [Clostridiales bacterium]
MKQLADYILNGNAVLGVEFGSTRIKAVLIGSDKSVLASGSHEWENKLIDGYWTYSLDAIWRGLQDSYAKLCEDVHERYGVKITKLKAIGISAMMHGYMPFDNKGNLLVPFRTWRNSTTAVASAQLSELFKFNIPQRWSIAHLYQAVLNNEPHIKSIRYLTTLAGYVHWQLTGRKAVGVGEASGIIPLDSDGKTYNTEMVKRFESIASVAKMPWKLSDILPEILPAGENAGYLTAEGAKLLDVSGNLQQGAPFCPPEGDAQTGMTATNSVKPKTGNISAGTSIFAMLTLDKPLRKYYREIDVVTTPVGNQVAMVHCNNCTSDINAWVDVFEQFATSLGLNLSRSQLFNLLFTEALKGDGDCSEMVSYNFYSGEHIVELTEGRPILVRGPKSKLTLANLVKTNLYSAFCVLRYGLDILYKEENVKIDKIVAQGGLFKVKNVAQQFLSDALKTPIVVRDTAGEGGAWGMALLAAYMFEKDNLPFDKYLDDKVFCQQKGDCCNPSSDGMTGFDRYYQRFLDCLEVEREAVRRLR